MKLINVLEIISEHSQVRVYNSNGDEVSRYDGRESIPECLNNETIDKIKALEDYFTGDVYIAIDLV